MLSGRKTNDFVSHGSIGSPRSRSPSAGGDSVTSAETGRHMPTSPASVVGDLKLRYATHHAHGRAFATQTRSMSSHSHFGVPPLSSARRLLQHTGSLHAPLSSRRTGTAACLPKIFRYVTGVTLGRATPSRWLGQISCLIHLDFLAISSPLASGRGGIWHSSVASCRKPASITRSPCPNIPAYHLRIG